jgi:hypothetical protein
MMRVVFGYILLTALGAAISCTLLYLWRRTSRRKRQRRQRYRETAKLFEDLMKD